MISFRRVPVFAADLTSRYFTAKGHCDPCGVSRSSCKASGEKVANLTNPIGSMYGIFTYIWVIFRTNVGKYSIYGAGQWTLESKIRRRWDLRLRVRVKQNQRNSSGKWCFFGWGTLIFDDWGYMLQRYTRIAMASTSMTKQWLERPRFTTAKWDRTVLRPRTDSILRMTMRSSYK